MNRSRIHLPTLRNVRMQYKLLLAFVLVSLIPLLVSGFYSINLSNQTIRQKTGAYSQELVSQVSKNLDSRLQSIKDYSDDFIFSADINRRLYGYPAKSPLSQLTVRNFFSIQLQLRFLNMSSVDDALMIFYKDRTAGSYDLSHLAENYHWSKEDLTRIIAMNEAPGNTRNITLSVASLAGTGQTYIILGRKIIQAATGEIYGHLLIAIRPEYFSDIFVDTRIGEDSQICMIDQSGTVLSSLTPDLPIGQRFPDASLFEQIAAGTATHDSFQFQLAGTEMQVTIADIGTSGLRAILLVPVSYLDTENAQFINQILILTLVILALSVTLAVVMARGIAAPLQQLAANMTRFGEGGSYQARTDNRSDEIGDLEKSFDNMTRAIQELVARIEEENRIRRLSELRVLEYQINPHFLYNTLDSINWMAQKGSQPEVGAMITALARFYRLGLSKGKETYSIQDEIDHIRNYLLLTQLRQRDKFQFEIDVEPEILGFKTLRIILLPLVENAIKYGIRSLPPGTGLIRITGRLQGDQIILTVTDNGKGVEPERLRFINDSLSAQQEISEDENGFGLLNVSQRLRLNYGEAYGVVLTSEPGQGTTSKINISVKR